MMKFKMRMVTDEMVDAARGYISPKYIDVRGALEAAEAVREPDLLPGLRRAWKIADRSGAIVTAMQLGAEIARLEQRR